MKKRKGLRVSAYTLLVVLALNVVVFLFFNRPADRALFIDPVTNMNTEERVVALTFDDGPSGKWTPLLLDLLNKYDAKGTFFMNGVNMLKYPDVVERIVREGHLAANHTMYHDRMIYKLPSTIEADIAEMDGLLDQFGVKDKSYFRPPYGDKMVILPLVLNSEGKKLITWDVDPLAQYEQPFDADKVAAQMLEQVKPGSIIVLHDGRDSDPTPFLTAVETVLSKLSSEGYRFITVKEGYEKYGTL